MRTRTNQRRDACTNQERHNSGTAPIDSLPGGWPLGEETWIGLARAKGRKARAGRRGWLFIYSLEAASDWHGSNKVRHIVQDKSAWVGIGQWVMFAGNDVHKGPSSVVVFAKVDDPVTLGIQGKIASPPDLASPMMPMRGCGSDRARTRIHFRRASTADPAGG